MNNKNNHAGTTFNRTCPNTKLLISSTYVQYIISNESATKCYKVKYTLGRSYDVGTGLPSVYLKSIAAAHLCCNCK